MCLYFSVYLSMYVCMYVYMHILLYSNSSGYKKICQEHVVKHPNELLGHLVCILTCMLLLHILHMYTFMFNSNGQHDEYILVCLQKVFMYTNGHIKTKEKVNKT
jgi:hypothetical protein